MADKLNLCIMFGGRSTEYEVSLMSSYSVLENVDKEKYNVVKVGITREGVWYIYDGPNENIKNNTWVDEKYTKRAFMSSSYGDRAVYAVNSDNTLERVAVDVVFPVMHGAYCEDGRLQGLLDMCGIAYVGPGCASSAVCMDKAFTKMLLNNYGIPMAGCVYATKKTILNDIDGVINDVESSFGYPVFVKPANSGSSVGVSKAKDTESLKIALQDAIKYDSKILIEEFIQGREIEVAVMGNEDPIALSRGEVVPDAEFYDYDDKYKNGTTQFHIPAKIKKSTWINLKRTAEGIYEYLDCRGLSRVDFFVCGKEEKIVFNEINTLPGFTSISLYPRMAMEYGMTYSEVIDKLVELALENNKKEI